MFDVLVRHLPNSGGVTKAGNRAIMHGEAVEIGDTFFLTGNLGVYVDDIRGDSVELSFWVERGNPPEQVTLIARIWVDRGAWIHMEDAIHRDVPLVAIRQAVSIS